MHEALERALPVIDKRTRYVRALNLIMASRNQVYAASRFSEDPDYFQMRTRHTDGLHTICSEPYPGEQDWQIMDNGTVAAYELG